MRGWRGLLGIRNLVTRVRWFLFDKCKSPFTLEYRKVDWRTDADDSRWYDWIGAVGGGGMMTVGLIIAIWRIVVSKE
jgi:hypothetical protein